MANYNFTSFETNELLAQDVREILFELIVDYLPLNTYHVGFTGVEQDEQIPFATRIGITGVAAPTNCTLTGETVEIDLTDKFWRPKKIISKLLYCEGQLPTNQQLLNKASTTVAEVTTGIEQNGAESEALRFMIMLIGESLEVSIPFRAWFADKTAATIANGGMITNAQSAIVPKISMIDGWYKRAFTAVPSSSAQRVEITQNTAATKALQNTFTGDAAVNYAIAVIDAMPLEMRSYAQTNRGELFMHVTSNLYMAIKRNIQRKDFDNRRVATSTLEDGLFEIRVDGYLLVERIDHQDAIHTYFDQGATYHLPHRIVFSSRANLPYATKSETEITNFKIRERDDDRTSITYGYSFDTQLLRESLIVMAY